MSSPETSRTRALSVADILRNRIFDGEIPPGAHLMEVTLAQELGVSRTPVRDALARLADEGLLVYQPNRGFLVRQFHTKDIKDAFTVRATLESLGCRLIGERGLLHAEQERLAALLEAQRKVLHDEEWNDGQALLWQDMNLDFHFALLALADNSWLTDAVRRARQLPIIFDSKSHPHDHEALLLLYRREHSRQALGDHYRIVDALAQREVGRAEALMREHILTNRDVLVRALSKNTPGGPAVQPAQWVGQA
ncbi:GntR family transcriptional regulator [Cupriavidus basilensis]|uniref:GntR family transcriptional regulator n=1 Tax=Cupriavidus basilensis TaxID=68895 RepID=A0ABT6ATB1_9BURK|nr:GntR family transcriptional regulator [Cupriavidus basilensis]MDF3835840.1 GntR family transcriptional regulator [Cupriavidus basilensis]